MKRIPRFFLSVCVFLAIFLSVSQVYGSNNNENDDNKSDIFSTTITCDEEQIDLVMDFEKQAVIIPGQDIFGEMAGYMKAKYDSRYWMITSAEINKKGLAATLEVINDYGSEDLTATLTYNPKDSTYTLRQGQGSTIKFAKNRKWQKLPKELVFKKK